MFLGKIIWKWEVSITFIFVIRLIAKTSAGFLDTYLLTTKLINYRTTHIQPQHDQLHRATVSLANCPWAAPSSLRTCHNLLMSNHVFCPKTTVFCFFNYCHKVFPDLNYNVFMWKCFVSHIWFTLCSMYS